MLSQARGIRLVVQAGLYGLLGSLLLLMLLLLLLLLR
jgi:hypothetical protein